MASATAVCRRPVHLRNRAIARRPHSDLCWSARATIGGGSARRLLAGSGTDQNLGRSASGHRCNFWDHADIREYIDTSDLHALVAPRTLVVQTGKKDDTYSSFRARIGNHTVNAYFAGDKQVARRSRAAYASSPDSFVHYLHYDKHRYHTGVVAPRERGSERFVQEPVTVEPPPAHPWSVDWQADSCTTRTEKVLF
jgi:hypothetical protein